MESVPLVRELTQRPVDLHVSVDPRATAVVDGLRLIGTRRHDHLDAAVEAVDTLRVAPVVADGQDLQDDSSSVVTSEDHLESVVGPPVVAPRRALGLTVSDRVEAVASHVHLAPQEAIEPAVPEPFVGPGADTGLARTTHRHFAVERIQTTTRVDRLDEHPDELLRVLALLADLVEEVDEEVEPLLVVVYFPKDLHLHLHREAKNVLHALETGQVLDDSLEETARVLHSRLVGAAIVPFLDVVHLVSDVPEGHVHLDVVDRLLLQREVSLVVHRLAPEELTDLDHEHLPPVENERRHPLGEHREHLEEGLGISLVDLPAHTLHSLGGVLWVTDDTVATGLLSGERANEGEHQVAQARVVVVLGQVLHPGPLVVRRLVVDRVRDGTPAHLDVLDQEEHLRVPAEHAATDVAVVLLLGNEMHDDLGPRRGVQSTEGLLVLHDPQGTGELLVPSVPEALAHLVGVNPGLALDRLDDHLGGQGAVLRGLGEHEVQLALPGQEIGLVLRHLFGPLLVGLPQQEVPLASRLVGRAGRGEVVGVDVVVELAVHRSLLQVLHGDSRFYVEARLPHINTHPS